MSHLLAPSSWGTQAKRKTQVFPNKGKCSHQSSATEGCQTQSRGRWDTCSRDPCCEEIQKRRSYGECSCERYYPTSHPNQSSLSSSCHSWSTHIEDCEVERYMQGQKGKSKEVTPPNAKTRRNTTPLCADQVITPRLSDNFEIPLVKSFDGRGDLANHIENFHTHPSLYNLPDEVACQVFPLTLKGKAQEWFNGFPQ
jgi:hypothetical protein